MLGCRPCAPRIRLPELNQAVREWLVQLNERPFRERDGSRSSLFHSLEKPALAPLPAELG